MTDELRKIRDNYYGTAYEQKYAQEMIDELIPLIKKVVRGEIKDWAIQKRVGLDRARERAKKTEPRNFQKIASYGGRLKGLQQVIDNLEALKEQEGK